MGDPQKTPESGICVLGKQVSICVEADEFFTSDVTVTFEGFYYDDQDQVHLLPNWSEKLEAFPASAENPGTGRKITRVPWKVNVNSNEEAARHRTTLLATVRGTGQSSARKRVARSRDKIIIPGFKLTADPKLTRIMLHEFSTLKDSSYVFDPVQVQSCLDELSPEQRELLANYPVEKPDGRLVIFITLTPRNDLLFGADYCARGANMIKPNATFAVFYCLGPGRDVTLICYSRYMLVNRRNPHTNVLITTRRGGKSANDWLSKSNKQPVRFKIATILPQFTTDGCILCRLFDENGVDVMPGNTVHGMINTKGCWMVFRNFNWPIERYMQFSRIYCLHREGFRSRVPQRTPQETRTRLSAERYDVENESNGNSSSYDKFFLYDRNFAYLWFCHEIVGIKYFSDFWRFGGRTLNPDPGRRVNDYCPTGMEFSPTFPLKELKKDPEYNLPDEGAHAYYDDQARREEDKSALQADPSAPTKPFEPDASLWRNNALGFQTARDFIPGAFGKGVTVKNLSKSELSKYSWADVYLFREESVNMDTTPRIYLEPI